MGRKKKKGEMRKVVEIGEKRGLIGVLKKQGKKWKREVIGIYINGFVHILMKWLFFFFSKVKGTNATFEWDANDWCPYDNNKGFFLKKKIYEYFLNRKLTVRIFSNFLFYKI